VFVPRAVAAHFAVWVLVVCAAQGCTCAPARSKPWRHAAEPAAAEVPSTIDQVLAGEKNRMAALAARGDTFTVWLDGDPRTLVPLADPTEWSERIALGTIFETLLIYRPGESARAPGGYEPGLAKNWRVLDGGRSLAIDLQPDVQFHDGSKLSSVDVQFSLDAARSARGGADHLRPLLASVSAVELAGPRGVRIYLHRVDANLLRALAEVPILPAKVYASRLRGGPGAPVVGTGPYKLESADPGGSVSLARFDGYWGPKPAIARIVFRRETDAARALGMLRGGEIDFVPALIPAHYPAQAQGPRGAAELAAVRLRPPAFRYLVLNTRKPPFDDPQARCAVSRLVDRPLLVAKQRGLARAIGGPIWPGGPGDGPESAPPAHDAAAAARLLEAAGWRDEDGDGARSRGARRLLLTVLVSDRQDDERDAVLEQLRAAGFVLDTREGSLGVLDNRLRDGRFDLAFVEWRGEAGADLAPLFASGGGKNFGGFSDPRVDAVLAGLRESWDPAARWSAMKQLGDLLAETCPIVPLTAPDPYGLVARRVSGLVVRGGWLILPALSLAR
jgi:peptide/nickel transport system substrate-binding protein